MSNESRKVQAKSCGELRGNNEGEMVRLRGWVHNWRNHGGIIFIDLRDRSGISQLVFNPSQNKELSEMAETLRHEYVIMIGGTVHKRPESMVNPALPTGEIEIIVDTLVVLSKSATPPLHINDPEANESEELRFRYRYLDLRRPSMQKNIIFRHRVTAETRKYLWDNDFIEIETPILMKSTPEGARDFLVPSRLNKGKFYALPQSPQTYKQILMVSGFERYFQIARCFRDEDLRADRQLEFTQIDAELSFITEEDIYRIFEALMETLFRNCLQKDISFPFLRMTYAEAFRTYGTDRPDLRFGVPIVTISDLFGQSQFQVFRNVLGSGGVIAGVTAPECSTFTRKNIDNVTNLVGKYGAKGLLWLRCTENGVEGPTAKFFSEKERTDLVRRMDAKTGDLLLLVAAPENICYTSLGQLRLEIGRVCNLLKKDRYSFLWVNEFPLFEYDEEEQRYGSVHHPFTAPLEEDVCLLNGSEYHKARSRAYDLVLNGVELGGGSIRIHDSVLQQKIFDLLKIPKEEAQSKFGFLLRAFNYGPPPHGGIAFGLDRLVMMMLGLESIRDTIPFPKTTAGISLMDNAPDIVSERQLKELGIQLESRE